MREEARAARRHARAVRAARREDVARRGAEPLAVLEARARDAERVVTAERGEVSRVGEAGTSNAGVFSVRTLSGTAAEGPLWFPTCVTWNAVKR